MSIALPTIPKQADVKPRLVRAGGDIGGQQGGAIQRIMRLGARYAFDVSLPKMDIAQANEWVAALLGSDTLGDTLVLTVPQPALAVALGAPLVDGAGQAGTTLAVRGLTAGITVPKGRFFSVTAGARAYLYMTRTAVVADGTGHATLQVAPKIRKAAADGAALDFVTAKLEGFIEAAELPWSIEYLTWSEQSFSIKENR